MQIAIVGTGYVGLVSGVCLAAKGHHVTCVDINPNIVSRLNEGHPHIYEKSLPELLTRVRAAGRFEATNNLEAALDRVELVIVAVGTPSERGTIDLRFVLEAARQIGGYIAKHDRHISVVVKSTVVAGTTDTSVRSAIEISSGKKYPAFGLGMNPEFLREGDAISDFMEPDRIVMGYEDHRTLERLEALYAPWDVDKVRVNTRTAEMIKYANNALLATQISAVNEIANLVGSLGGIDILDVMKGVHLDKRWNPLSTDGVRVSPQVLTYLLPGCGFGGSCFPKDVEALRTQGEEHGTAMRLLNAVLDVNSSQPSQVVKIIERDIPDIAGVEVLVLGLAFKPDTDDVRESASIKIVSELLARNARVLAHDPVAIERFKEAIGSLAEEITFIHDWQCAVPSARVIVVATKWSQYQALTGLDLDGKLVFDARRMFTPTALGAVDYRSIGLRTA